MKKGLKISLIVIGVLIIGIVWFLLRGAGEGRHFSDVYKIYPDHCKKGLTEWDSGFDTRISIGEECYDTMMESGYPVGTCINCGDGICSEIESVCNCPEDCGPENSDYTSVEDFCDDYVGANTALASMCEEDTFDLSICKLCDWN